jgi:hypothetical protein
MVNNQNTYEEYKFIYYKILFQSNWNLGIDFIETIQFVNSTHKQLFIFCNSIQMHLSIICILKYFLEMLQKSTVGLFLKAHYLLD